MNYVFIICALVGGTILACQVVLSLLGIIDVDVDLADDIPDDLDADFGSGDSLGDGHSHLDSSLLFGVISFRTLVAAATFFGLVGMLMRSAKFDLTVQLISAVAAGVAAMYGVHFIMLSFYRLGQSGNADIRHAVGKQGKVYLPIPAENQGPGKVMIVLAGQLSEYSAITYSPEQLATGTQVRVVKVHPPDTLEVELLSASSEET